MGKKKRIKELQTKANQLDVIIHLQREEWRISTEYGPNSDIHQQAKGRLSLALAEAAMEEPCRCCNLFVATYCLVRCISLLYTALKDSVAITFL